jgi:hypothetical protein
MYPLAITNNNHIAQAAAPSEKTSARWKRASRKGRAFWNNIHKAGMKNLAEGR